MNDIQEVCTCEHPHDEATIHCQNCEKPTERRLKQKQDFMNNIQEQREEISTLLDNIVELLPPDFTYKGVKKAGVVRYLERELITLVATTRTETLEEVRGMLVCELQKRRNVQADSLSEEGHYMTRAFDEALEILTSLSDTKSDKTP